MWNDSNRYFSKCFTNKNLKASLSCIVTNYLMELVWIWSILFHWSHGCTMNDFMHRCEPLAHSQVFTPFHWCTSRAVLYLAPTLACLPVPHPQHDAANTLFQWRNSVLRDVLALQHTDFTCWEKCYFMVSCDQRTLFLKITSPTSPVAN